uniref:Magnesium-protoporphyrin IX methyltransferase C-terminal domain-containing protein n=1 Tax=Salix viminalis TaxID=40686 RepID=A0A6N2NIE5_SALVM
MANHRPPSHPWLRQTPGSAHSISIVGLQLSLSRCSPFSPQQSLASTAYCSFGIDDLSSSPLSPTPSGFLPQLPRQQHRLQQQHRRHHQLQPSDKSYQPSQGTICNVTTTGIITLTSSTRRATVTASLPPLAAEIAADLEGTTLSVVGGGTGRCHITHRPRTSAAPPGGGDKEVVREYSNNSGFQRWRKIYEGTDDVNREHMDISHGHSKPYLVSNFVQAKEQLQAGSENVVPVTTNLKRVGELFPGPSKATRAYIHAEADVERALKKVGWKIRKRGLVTTQFYLARLVEAVPV